MPWNDREITVFFYGILDVNRYAHIIPSKMTSYFGQHRILSPSIRLIIYSIQKETAKEYPQICKNIRKTELACKIKIPHQ